MCLESETTVSCVSAIAVIDLAHELLSCKAIHARFLTQLGRPFLSHYKAWQAGTSIQEARLPEQLIVTLWNEASRTTSDQPLGLLIGRKVNLHSKGILANWLSQSDTLEEAFDIFQDNIHLLNPSEQWLKSYYDDHINLTLRFRSPAYPLAAIERSMAAIVAWGSRIAGTKISPLYVSFRHDAPRKLSQYKAIFGPELRFSEERDSLGFSLQTFALPTLSANSYLKGLLEARAASISTLLGTSEKHFTREVQTLLTENMPLYCQIGEACKTLNVSRSTLFRRLKSEHTSFSRLVVDARLVTAAHLEKNGAVPTAIAEALGFRDSGSYYRFRKTYAVSEPPRTQSPSLVR